MLNASEELKELERMKLGIVGGKSLDAELPVCGLRKTAFTEELETCSAKQKILKSQKEKVYESLEDLGLIRESKEDTAEENTVICRILWKYNT